ncbi:alkyl hydroperoxide reductase [Riemerella anatipestifer]|uniref:TlpA family protein disulfide reductase n=1 Tax=Riemerella anatipestifer TaxID=34085 RepID=UPI0007ED1E37|nr:redoxin domain-containing protein [Riemerella anatipestifer]OBP40769.1 alkyl hydroperoxide reductase [Riemerella anatipestifer]
MKKYLLLVLFAILMVSCSKNEVQISGTLKNASPLDRIELINVSSASSLPIMNIGVDAKGNFSATPKIEEGGIYLITYARQMNFIYLKKGDNIKITADATEFPRKMKILGDGEKNNEFLTQMQSYIEDYMSKIDMQLMSKSEKEFIAAVKKIQTDVDKKIEEVKSKTKPDSEVVEWKSSEMKVTLLMIIEQYAAMHGAATGNPNFKPSAEFTKYQDSLKGDEKKWIKTLPTYRSYLLIKNQEGFTNFMNTLQNKEISTTEAFVKYLEGKKDIDQYTKDHLIAFVATQYDLQPQHPRIKQVMEEVVNKSIKDSQIKKELEKVKLAIQGIEVGQKAPSVDLVNNKGEKVSLSKYEGKPSVLIFYASWNPYVSESLTPSVKQLATQYGGKVNLVMINLDDTEDQFKKTEAAMFKGLKVESLYAKNGMNSETADKFGIYGFKLPSAVVIDKDGKVASPATIGNIDMQIVDALNKLSQPTAKK